MRTYTSGLALFEDTWKFAPKRTKVALLKSVDAHPSFAVTGSVKEMVNRGGGLAAGSLLRVHNLYLKKKGGSVTIRDW